MAFRIIVVDRDGLQHSLAAEPGQSLMEMIRDGNFADPFAICGGSCSCGTCHIYVSPESIQCLPQLHEEEDMVLDGLLHRSEASRLSCQVVFTPVLNGAYLRIAPAE